MNRFHNILMLYAGRVGDESALERATALARRNNALLTVAATLDCPAASNQGLVEEKAAHLARLVTSIRSQGLDVRSRVLLGRDFMAVIRAVLKDGYDLVVMTADRVQGIRALAFGTTSMHLMRKCPCPVWVMNPDASGRFRRIVAAVALGVDGPSSPLDIKITQMASSLARTEGGRLDLIHAWDFNGEDLDLSRSEMTAEVRSRLFGRYEHARAESMDRLLSHVEVDDIDLGTHIEHGRPEEVIPLFVRDNGVDLIVMGTVTRGGVAGLLIGTSAEHMLRMVDCSVLTIKPDDFVTPVQT